MNEHRIQAATGVVISSFVFTHVFNHFLMHFGPATHQQMFSRVRAVFKHCPLLEYTLFASLGTHALISFKNFSGFAWGQAYLIHQLSGWFLLIALPSHIYFGRFFGPTVMPKKEEYDLTYVTMATRVLPTFFLPFYTVLTGCGLVHAYTGIARAGRILDWEWAIKRLPISGPQYGNIVCSLALVGVSTAFAVAGVYFRYAVKHERALTRAVKSHLPAFIANRLDMANNVWFARYRVFPIQDEPSVSSSEP